jgi:hypothetical protein
MGTNPYGLSEPVTVDNAVQRRGGDRTASPDT